MMGTEKTKSKMNKESNSIKISGKKVKKAIDAVRQLNQKHSGDSSKKQPLLELDEDSPIFLQVQLKKIPPKKLFKRIKVPLPHPLLGDSTEVCLITGDVDKRDKMAEVDKDVLHYKEMLKKLKITAVKEVVTLRELRTEYKVYEARRQLMGAYDVFLADSKIAQCLPRLLGKSFYKKRKFPIQINMSNTKSLKGQINKALSSTVFYLNCRGVSITSEVAKLSMSNDQILENVLSTVRVLSGELPGRQENIQGLYLKSSKSQALPIYMSYGNPSEVKFERKDAREDVDFEELSTCPEAEVKVLSNGRIITQGYTGDSEGGPEGDNTSEDDTVDHGAEDNDQEDEEM